MNILPYSMTVVPALQIIENLAAVSVGAIMLLIIILLALIATLLGFLWWRSRRAPKSAPTVTPDVKRDVDETKPSVTLPAPAAEPDEAMAETQISERGIGGTLKLEGQPQIKPLTGERPDNIGWQIASLTDTGLKRNLNEDNLTMLEGLLPDDTPFGLYAIADGMGGHQKGEVASQLAVTTLNNAFKNNPPHDTYDEWLHDVAQMANETLLSMQPTDVTKDQKMGTTLVMALVVDEQVHIANVGDSRAYHITADAIEQVSVDHSYVERLIQIGQLTREEARHHTGRNIIYNTVGDKIKMEVGIHHTHLAPGERLLLCSDGLSGMITDETILAISQQHADPVHACQIMVAAAKEAGGDDNITAIIVQRN